jgi:hypothetical protein
VTLKNLQTGALALSTLFAMLAFAVLGHSAFLFIPFLVVLYACVFIAVGSTLVRYRREERFSLARWRCIPYALGLILLLSLCLCSLAIWVIALSGIWLRGASHRPDYLFLCLFGANIIAPILSGSAVVGRGSD